MGRTREAVGEDFIIIYRLSMIDLIPDGSTWDETVMLAKAVEAAGATIINTGIGWHEARVPTIATSVPRGAFTWVTRKMKEEVSIPLVTSNRINLPGVAEEILARGDAELPSWLSDPTQPEGAIPRAPAEDRSFETERARRELLAHFGVVTLEAFGCESLPRATIAAGAALRYVLRGA